MPQVRGKTNILTNITNGTRLMRAAAIDRSLVTTANKKADLRLKESLDKLDDRHSKIMRGHHHKVHYLTEDYNEAKTRRSKARKSLPLIPIRGSRDDLSESHVSETVDDYSLTASQPTSPRMGKLDRKASMPNLRLYHHQNASPSTSHESIDNPDSPDDVISSAPLTPSSERKESCRGANRRTSLCDANLTRARSVLELRALGKVHEHRLSAGEERLGGAEPEPEQGRSDSGEHMDKAVTDLIQKLENTLFTVSPRPEKRNAVVFM